MYFLLWFPFYCCIVFASVHFVFVSSAHLTVPNQAAVNVLVIFYLCQSLILSMLNFNHSSVLGEESDYRNVE